MMYNKCTSIESIEMAILFCPIWLHVERIDETGYKRTHHRILREIQSRNALTSLKSRVCLSFIFASQ